MQNLTNLLAQVKSRGVDSVGEGFADPVAIVSSLARKERTQDLLTVNRLGC